MLTREMKDSGVEWIGEVPRDWEISTISREYSSRMEKVSDFQYKPLSVTKNGIVPQLENAAKSANHSDRKLVLKNDFVINSRSDRKMSSGVSIEDGSVSLINTVIYSNSILPEYSNYLLKNSSFAEEFYRWGTGIVADLWSTNWEKMKKIAIPVPQIENQKEIADVLESKVKVIDTILLNTQQSIIELKKYKQSLITEAVTKGLDKNAEMKDSGIEWIGDVPKIWNKSRFKNELTVRGRVGWKGLTASEYIEQKGYAFLSTPDIKYSSIDFSKVNHITEERYFESPEIMLSVGDVLLTKDGSTLGTCNIVRNLPEPATVNSSIAVLRVKDKIEPLYLLYYLKSKFIQSNIEFIKNGMGVPHLFQKDINEFTIFYPDREIQKNIILYLEKKTQDIDNLVKDKEQIIKEYEEYKKSLIYEYVTGKKQV